MQSVRAQYIKPLDPVLLNQLVRPLARSVYRLLDAKRYDPTDPQIVTMELRMTLADWGQECKLKDLVPSRIKRTLEKAHDDLKACGYLADVEYEGSGSRQEIIYRFGDGPSFGLDLVTGFCGTGSVRPSPTASCRACPARNCCTASPRPNSCCRGTVRASRTAQGTS
ncbi:hypothetical protein CTI14_32460 [Methylobacterium radiotolerans]|nr:hypothetical protein CTI14_32460 [Methylobacterium radiotolerans]